MVAKDLLVTVRFSSWPFRKAPSEHVENTGFKEYRSGSIMFANGLVYFAIGWKQVLVIGHAWKEEVSRVLVYVSSNWLIEELISY